MVTRFGISRGVSPREPLSAVGDLAREVEDLGFDALWFIDHQLGMKDVYTAMTLSALATERIEIGAGVTNLTTRHPTVTANATAALDEVSGGRALLGLGAGWVAVHSIGREPERLGAIRRGIAEFRQLFSGEEADLYGTRVRLATATRQVPVYLAVSQPGMLRLAGETLRRGGGDGSGGPRVLPLAARLHPRGPRAERPASASDITIDLFVTMSVDDDERPGGKRRARVGDEPGRDLPGLEARPARLGTVPARVPARPADATSTPTTCRFARSTRRSSAGNSSSRSRSRATERPYPSNGCAKLATLDFDRITFALLSGGRRRRLRAARDGGAAGNLKP